MKKSLKVFGVVGLLLGTAPVVEATSFALDEFNITRNGSLMFKDTFDNGDPMNTGWVFANGNTATYASVPDTLPGTEVNGRYIMNPLAGDVNNSNLNGSPIHVQRMRLETNTSNNVANLGQGLKDDDSFTIMGIFDLIMPDLLDERFGVRLTDMGSANGSGDDVVEVTMQRRESGVVVQYREQNFATSSYNLFDRLEFSAAALGLSDEIFAMYDQIALFLDRPDANSDIYAGFKLLDSDNMVSDFVYNFAGGATIFEGERFTRAEIIAIAPVAVPEAASLGMMLLAILLLTGTRRRTH